MVTGILGGGTTNHLLRMVSWNLNTMRFVSVIRPLEVNPIDTPSKTQKIILPEINSLHLKMDGWNTLW